MRRSLIAACFALLAVAPENSQAAACAPGTNPFTDIDDNIFFCTNTLWLRNANVTLGCGNGSTYCPDDFVPRSQMALFMNRLARALTPEILVDTGGPPQGTLEADVHTCQSPSVYTVPPGNQRFISAVNANLSILTTADADIAVTVDMQTDGGAFVPISTPTMVVHVPGNKWTMASVHGNATLSLGIASLAVQPGQTLVFRVTMRRNAGSATTGQVSSTRCQLRFESIISYAQN